MNRPRPPSAAPRSLRRRLAALERMRAFRLDAARMALGVEQGKAAALEKELARKEDEEAQAVQAASALWERRLDPLSHASTMAYVAAVHAGTRKAQAGLEKAAERAATFRAACVEQDVQLALVRKLREAAEQQHRLDHLRVEQKQADLASLIRRGRQRP